MDGDYQRCVVLWGHIDPALTLSQCRVMARHLFRLTVLFTLVASVLCTGCVSEPLPGDINPDERDKIDIPLDIFRNAPSPYKVDLAIFNYANDRNWGARHVDWHNLRRLSKFGDNAFRFEDDYRERHGLNASEPLPRVVQEGQAGSGISFCAMHSVMVSLLSKQASLPEWDRWRAAYGQGVEAVDGLLVASLTELGLDEPSIAKVREMQALMQRMEAIPASSPNQPDIDTLCSVLETAIRPDGGYGTNRGIHNTLHAYLTKLEDEERGDVRMKLSDSRVNIYHERFYHPIHGYIEARFRLMMDARHPDCVDDFSDAHSSSDESMIMRTCGTDYGIEVHHHFHGMQEVYAYPASNVFYEQIAIDEVPTPEPTSATATFTPGVDGAPGDGMGASCSALGGFCFIERGGVEACSSSETAVTNTSCDNDEAPIAGSPICCVR